MSSHEEVLRTGHYPDEGRWPFMRMDAEAHFALVGARQLLRARRTFDGNERVGPMAQVLSHSARPTGRALHADGGGRSSLCDEGRAGWSMVQGVMTNVSMTPSAASSQGSPSP
jgi:hypothetical protein